MLRRIGTTKAKSQVTQFIEGSDLTTSREMKTQEKVEIQDGKETITFSEEYRTIFWVSRQTLFRQVSCQSRRRTTPDHGSALWQRRIAAATPPRRLAVTLISDAIQSVLTGRQEPKIALAAANKRCNELSAGK